MKHLRIRLATAGLWLACLAAYTLSWVLAKQVLADAPPMWSGAGRLLASFAVLLLVVALNRSARVPASDLQQRLPLVLLLAVLGFAGYFTLTFLALRLMPSSDLVMLLALTPGVTYLLGIVFYRERLDILRSLGVALATACVMLFQGVSTSTPSPDRLAGMGLALVAITGYSLYGLVYGRTMRNVPVVGLLAALTGIATVMVATWAWMLEGPPPALQPRTLLAIACIGALLSAPVYIMVNKLVLAGGAFLATLVGLVAPFTVLLLESALGLRLVTARDLLLMTAAAGALIMVLRGGARSTSTPLPAAPALKEQSS